MAPIIGEDVEVLYRILLMASFVSLIGPSCSKVGTLNLKKHRFGEVPNHIIWMQIPGLTEEHIALLKFGFKNESHKISFEKMGCIGKMWNFNLFDLRPGPEGDFLSQVTGRKKINNSCENFEMTPVWDYFSREGMTTGIFEVATGPGQSFAKALSCGQKKFLKRTIMWKMAKAVGKKEYFFHRQEKQSFVENKIYYDKACQKGPCYSMPVRNIETLYKRFKKKKIRSFFLYRDFSFYNALAKKNILKAKEKLIEIEKVFRFFYKWQEEHSQTLLLLTSAGAKGIEFPAAGREWSDFEVTGKFVSFKKTNLLSLVLSAGSSSENYCGIYNSSDLLTRLFWHPGNNKSFINNFFSL